MAVDPSRHLIHIVLRDEFGNELPAQEVSILNGEDVDAPSISPLFISDDDQDVTDYSQEGAPPLITDARGRLSVWTTALTQDIWAHYTYTRDACPVVNAEQVLAPFAEIRDVNIGGLATTTALNAEATARADGDAALGARIDAEESARTAADDDATARLSVETQRREAADAALGTRVDDEASTRAGADTALGQRIDTEQTAREAADTALGTRIDTEISDRTSADAALGARIDGEETARIAGDDALGVRVAALEARPSSGGGGGGGDGADGSDGWSPLLSLEDDGGRQVLRVRDWIGGTGTKPTTTGYIGAGASLSPTAAGAVNLKGADGADGIDGTDGTDGRDGTDGADGADGLNGWSPLFAVETDGERRVMRVVGWTGGTGTAPATGYLGASGVVSSAGAAVDIRGPAGRDGSGGGGTDIPAGGVTFNDLATALQTLINGKADQSALDAEITARTNADAALGTRIDDKADASALTAEETARTSADAVLGNRIDDKADASALTSETTARTSADAALGTRIDGLPPQLKLRVVNDVLEQSVDDGANYTDLGTFGGAPVTPPAPVTTTLTWAITDYEGTLADYDASSDAEVTATVGVPAEIDTSGTPATLGQDFLVTTATGYELTAMVNQGLNNDELHGFEVADKTGGGKVYRIANLRAGAYFIYHATVEAVQ